METPFIPTLALRIAVALGIGGVLASLAVHVTSLSGASASLTLEFLFFAWVFAAFGPVVTALIRQAEEEIGPIASGDTIPNPLDVIRKSFQMNVWMFRFLSIGERIVFGLLLVYTGAQMVFGFIGMASTPEPEGFPLAMASAFWLYFFGVSVLTGRRLLAVRAETPSD